MISELRVYAQTKNGDRAAVPVIGGVGHILVVCGNREVFVDAHRIERLHNVFRPVMGQLPVAD